MCRIAQETRIKMIDYNLPKLPNSSKKILLILSEYGNLTQKELIQTVNMPAKTVRYALRRLAEEGLIVTMPNLGDMRSCYYSLNPDQNYRVIDLTIEDARILFATQEVNS